MKKNVVLSEQLRVAMLIHSYHPMIGGAERQLGAIAPLLKQRGLEIHVLTRRHRDLPAEEIIADVYVHRLPIPGPKPMAALSFIFSALKKIWNIHPHIIHAHEMYSTATAAVMAKRWLEVPIVITPHSSGPGGDVQRLQSKLFGKKRMSIIRDQVDAFAVISREIKEELILAGVPSERCFMIPNGVDVNTYKPLPSAQKEKLRLNLGYQPDDLIVVFTGRLVPLKRVSDLLAVWPKIIFHHPNARLLILGNGSEEERLRSQAGKGVDFLGNIRNVVQYLQLADLFVLPSSIEGLSLALLEAMACGLPAVATAVGGNVDLILHNQDGWLVPLGELNQLEEGILKLLFDPALRERLGCNARQKILENYSLEKMAQRLINLYNRIGMRT